LRQPERRDVALLHVIGQCQRQGGGHVGLCVPVVGKDAAGAILWACCLMAQCDDDAPCDLLESLLVDPAVLGRASSVWVRLYGGRIPVGESGRFPV
jgi:hypothetical protein